ncbi:unnamed protein product [Camellia sinensis]
MSMMVANHRNRALNQSILRLGTQKTWFRLRISMGKNEFLTPKAIANRIKAKVLQKLRWYCQMCQKQCRDENGFKCHCMSESHQRQMEVFGQNPHRIVDGYSEEFEREFLDHIKCSHCFSRIATTVVYNEYIADRHHIHMNSTQWATLNEFVKYLGRTGKCKVDETPKGWFITYIDRDSETLFKEKLKCKRARADLIDEEKQEREIRRQIGRAENGLLCLWSLSSSHSKNPRLVRRLCLACLRYQNSLLKRKLGVLSWYLKNLRSIQIMRKVKRTEFQ